MVYLLGFLRNGISFFVFCIKMTNKGIDWLSLCNYVLMMSFLITRGWHTLATQTCPAAWPPRPALCTPTTCWSCWRPSAQTRNTSTTSPKMSSTMEQLTTWSVGLLLWRWVFICCNCLLAASDSAGNPPSLSAWAIRSCHARLLRQMSTKNPIPAGNSSYWIPARMLWTFQNILFLEFWLWHIVYGGEGMQPQQDISVYPLLN